ncbi:MAG: MFS transporter [Gemmatimonadota bacterium]
MDDSEFPTPAPGFVRRTLASLGSRNFRLFFIGQTVSNTGNWLTRVALTLLVLHRTGSGVAVGVLAACQYGPILLISAWAGVMVDRTDKRRLLFTTQTLEMGQSFALAALAFMHDAPIMAFYGTAVAGGIMLAFDNPVRRTFVNEMVPLRDVPNAVTLYSAMVNLSRIAGPALAGVLIVTVGYGWCFTIDAVSYSTVLVALAMMRTGELRTVKAAPRGAGQIREGIRYITRVPELWVTFGMLLIIGLITRNFAVLFPLFVEHGLHGSDVQFTAVYSAFSVGALVGAVFVARRTDITIRTVVAGAVALGVAMLGMAAVPSAALAIAMAVVVGAASVAYMTATSAIVQIRTEQQMIGRVLAFQAILMIGTQPISGPIIGVISDTLGSRVAVIIAALGALAAAGFGLVANRRLRAQGQHHAET